MSSEAKRRATYQDVLAAPERVVAEVIDGVLYTQPRPRVRHARAASRLGALLGSRFDADDADGGGWVLLDEPELHLGAEPDIVVPDLAGWQRDRLPAELIDAAFVTLAPDWVCEVLSPSTARHDRTLKLPLYAREGVRWVWLLDPGLQLLETFALDGASWRLLASHAADATVHAPPFDGYALALAKLWAL